MESDGVGVVHPGQVRAVEIPKKGKKGGIRVLGIPSVVDRVAQGAAAMALEPGVELIFHEDSYGYRPGRAPVDAVAVCRERCFKKDWVVDLDIRAFLRVTRRGACRGELSELRWCGGSEQPSTR